MEGRFPRTLASLEPLSRFTTDFFTAHHLDPDRLSEIDLVIEELFTNCLKYHPESRDDITISLEWLDPELVLVLRDSGVGDFDITRVPPIDESAPIEKRRGGGIGLHLVRRIADEVQYRHANGTSTVTVRKRLR